MAEIIPNVVVSMPSQLFTLASKFAAAAAGSIYIGEIDKDPKVTANQIPVYVQNEDSTYTQVPQPIMINGAGYPVYNGQIRKFVTETGHSMSVYDFYGALQFYFDNVLNYDPDQLRQELETSGINIIKNGVKSVKFFADIKTGSHGIVDLIMTIEHHAGGLGAATYKRLPTTGVPQSGDERIVYDADGIGWQMMRQRVHSSRSFGLLGNGVDDLAAFNRAIAFVGTAGGGVIHTESLTGFNDCKVSDTVTIAYSNVELRQDPPVHIHSEAATTTGGLIHFSGSLTVEADRIKRVGVTGGTFSANGSGVLDNAIGFSGCEDYYVFDCTITHADRKAVTGQVNVVNGHVKNVKIGSTGFDAITLEGDTINGLIVSRGFVVEDVIIDAAGRYGVRGEGGKNGSKSGDLILKNVRVNAAAGGAALAFDNCNNVDIDRNCRVISSAGYGLSFGNAVGLTGYVNTLNTQLAGLVLISAGQVCLENVRINNAGLSGVNIFDAIYVATPVDTHELKNVYVLGTTHRYILNNTSATFQPVIVFPNASAMARGTLGFIANTGFAAALMKDPGMPTVTAATPDVFGRDNITMGSTTFNLTTLSNPYVGKKVSIHFTGGVTVVQGSTAGTFRLFGGVNITPAAGTVMTFIYTSENLWRELSRSF